MDINSPEFAKWLINLIDERADIKFNEKIKNVGLEQKAKVATSGSGATISVYIENSTTATDIKNPCGFSLTEGQLVMIMRPTFQNNNTRFITRIL